MLPPSPCGRRGGLPCPNPGKCQWYPALPWGFSLQRSSCGQRRTQGGSGEKDGKGQERTPRPCPLQVQPQAVVRASHLLCIPGTPFQLSGLRPGGPVLILEARIILEENYYPHLHNVGRERDDYIYRRERLISTGRCRHVALWLQGCFEGIFCLSIT